MTEFHQDVEEVKIYMDGEEYKWLVRRSDTQMDVLIDPE